MPDWGSSPSPYPKLGFTYGFSRLHTDAPGVQFTVAGDDDVVMARRLVPQLLQLNGANLAETGLDPGPLPHHGLWWRPGVPVTPTPRTPVSHGEPSPWLHHPAVVELLRVLRETPVSDKETRESLKLSPHGSDYPVTARLFISPGLRQRRGPVFPQALHAPWIPAKAGMDGLVLRSPYPKLELTGVFTSPYGKGWSARMAGHSRTLSTTLPQRPTRPWGLTPASPLSETGVM